MTDIHAEDFSGIPNALSQNTGLRTAVLALVAREPMAGKVTEGSDRLDKFRGILSSLINGQIGQTEAVRQTELSLPRNSSSYAGNNRVFPDGWAERLVRTQLSRFYNQAVMEQLIAEGETLCFVPHSSEEDGSSKCSQLLAGTNQNLVVLHSRLVSGYANGVWPKDVKIPEHPHCTHVVTRSR